MLTNYSIKLFIQRQTEQKTNKIQKHFVNYVLEVYNIYTRTFTTTAYSLCVMFIYKLDMTHVHGELLLPHIYLLDIKFRFLVKDNPSI